jgi:4-amino-4-deoxy-L-arabinose transferase-like glycosyltransferase
MFDFLHFHESHPPLFYALVHVWMLLFGATDTAVRAFCALSGAAIVPAVYVAGSRLFSKRAAVVAALLATFSPALNEHSTQIRPYGLMALLTLVSCYWMLRAIERRRRADWAIYIAATLLLLYTHNWAWLIAIGQNTAFVLIALRDQRAQLKSIAAAWLYSWMIIGIGILPWASALLYQVQNAGHAGVYVNGVVAAFELLIFGIFSSVQTLFLGRIVYPALVAVVGTVAATASAIAAAKIQRDRRAGAEASDVMIPGMRPGALLAIVIATITAAILLSPMSNQLLARCIATLIPLVALAAGQWIVSLWTGVDRVRFAPVFAAATLTFVIAAGVIDVFGIANDPRSNAREVAHGIKQNTTSSDLLIVAPEWFAPSFNHYFPRSIEQIDFPYRSRSGLIDFSDVWKRAADPERLAQLTTRLVQASASGRRVWLVSEVRYLHGVTDNAVRQAELEKDPAPYAMLRVAQIRATLERLYGQPDSLRVWPDTPALYDNLRAYLYSRRSVGGLSQR